MKAACNAVFFLMFDLSNCRYGREEMLALYIRTEQVPEELQQFSAILSEKAQDPLAFQHLSEEEQVCAPITSQNFIILPKVGSI